jgi:hypothetical protein
MTAIGSVRQKRKNQKGRLPPGRWLVTIDLGRRVEGSSRAITSHI